jgi:hypothetical protein
MDYDNQPTKLKSHESPTKQGRNTKGASTPKRTKQKISSIKNYLDVFKERKNKGTNIHVNPLLPKLPKVPKP